MFNRLAVMLAAAFPVTKVGTVSIEALTAVIPAFKAYWIIPLPICSPIAAENAPASAPYLFASTTLNSIAPVDQ